MAPTNALPDHVPPHLVVDVDVFDDSIVEKLHALSQDLLARTPVAWTQRNEGHWIVTRYDDVEHVLSTHEVFSSRRTTVPKSRDIDQSHKLIPVAYDPPEHTHYRELLAPLFAPQRMKQLEDQIRSVVVGLIEKFQDRGRCEFVSEFARPLPSTVFLLLMGWPLSDGDLFARWASAILHEPGGSGEEAAASAAAREVVFTEVHEYFDAVIADHRKNPRDDYTTQLVHGQYAGERPLSDDELRRLFLLLMIGGLHTVVTSLSNTIIDFAERPELQASLRADSGIIPHAVEEMLRFEPPVWSAREVVQPTTLSGVEMQAGDMVVCATTAANIDPAQFPGGDAIDLLRRRNRHLTFGAGVHKCVGAHLGRIELKVAFEELHRRIPPYRLDPERPPAWHFGPVNGVYHAHILFDQR